MLGSASAQAAPAIDFFFEFASPYSYLASLELPAIAARHGVGLRWRPIDVLEVWKSQGVLEPYAAVRAVKRDYIFQDATRVAAERGVSLVFPRHAGDPTLARLVFYALAEQDPSAAVRFAQGLWRRRFNGHRSTTEEDLVAAFENLSEETLRSAAQDPQPAAHLAAANAAAAGSQCFGVPWLILSGEVYFGQDRLYLLEKALSGISARPQS